MTAIVLLILGIRLAVAFDDRHRVVIIRARFVSYRRQFASILATPHVRRYAIRCLRFRAISQADEKTADLSR